jgi:hypothetical protein
MDFAVKAVIAIVIVVVLYLVGAGFVRGFAQGQPDDDGASVPLADVDLRYRCIVCGAEVVMYAAPDGDLPVPPRHCAERMALITPVS